MEQFSGKIKFIYDYSPTNWMTCQVIPEKCSDLSLHLVSMTSLWINSYRTITNKNPRSSEVMLNKLKYTDPLLIAQK